MKYAFTITMIMEDKKYSVADDIQIAKEDIEKSKQEIHVIRKEVRELFGVLRDGFFLHGRKRRKERRLRI